MTVTGLQNQQSNTHLSPSFLSPTPKPPMTLSLSHNTDTNNMRRKQEEKSHLQNQESTQKKSESFILRKQRTPKKEIQQPQSKHNQYRKPLFVAIVNLILLTNISSKNDKKKSQK